VSDSFSSEIDVTIGHVEKETKTFLDAGLEMGVGPPLVLLAHDILVDKSSITST
jgi:hypothetical protein